MTKRSITWKFKFPVYLTCGLESS